VLTVAAPNSGSILIGVLGILVGMFAATRWFKAKASFGGWQKARAGVPKAKAERSKARGAFLLASRAAVLGVVLLIVYLLATTTALFKN